MLCCLYIQTPTVLKQRLCQYIHIDCFLHDVCTYRQSTLFKGAPVRDACCVSVYTDTSDAMCSALLHKTLPSSSAGKRFDEALHLQKQILSTFRHKRVFGSTLRKENVPTRQNSVECLDIMVEALTH